MRYFLIGCIGYPALELLWRRRTHPSMALAGGLSTMLIHYIGKLDRNLIAKSLCCGAGITMIEAGCGLVWNKHHQVWDYTSMPLNWRGQVCLPFSTLWCLLSAALIQLDKAADSA